MLMDFLVFTFDINQIDPIYLLNFDKISCFLAEVAAARDSQILIVNKNHLSNVMEPFGYTKIC